MVTSTVVLHGQLIIEGVKFLWWVIDGRPARLTVSHPLYGTEIRPAEKEPEQQARMTELTSYAFANSRSKPQVDELVARFLPSKERAIFQDQDWWSKNFEAVNQRFVAWQSK